MKNLYLCFAIFFISSYPSSQLNAQGTAFIYESWDQKMIAEADIWTKLLTCYTKADRIKNWDKRNNSLNNVVTNFSNSRWIDDAELLLIGEMVIKNNDLNEAIQNLRNIIEKYPLGVTIIDDWYLDKGCIIDKTWLMMTSSLVYFDDNSINKVFPFNHDTKISIVEREVLTYFNHVDKYPQKTVDVAQYIIALMYRQMGDINAAILELEDLLSRYPDLSSVRTIDYNAAKKANGHLIEFVPPGDRTPIWRIQYKAAIQLLKPYQQQNSTDKLLDLALKLTSVCSPDG